MSGIDPRLIDSASLTAIGEVRTTNQDCCAEFCNPSGDRLLVVADGMGGHRGGATASQLATEVIGEVFDTASSSPPDTLREALITANQRVYERSLEDPELRGMGTTVVALLFDTQGVAWVAHVGDSRAYRLRAQRIEQLTHDHSVVAEMVRRELITPEQAEQHPRRNEILRSVGVDSEVEIDVAQVAAAPGDCFMLCSDGLTGMVSDIEIAEVIRSDSPANAAQRLVDMANLAGGTDNITVQIAMLPEAAIRPATPAEPAVPSAENVPSYRLLAAIAVALVVLLFAYLAVVAPDSEPGTTTPGSAIEGEALQPGATGGAARP